MRNLLEATLLASAVSRRGVSKAEQPVREVGRQLFQALFPPGPVYGTYRASLGAALQRGRRLRVVLRLTAPELAALPWEMLFDPETEAYLCRQEPLVRHVHAPYTADPLQVRPPLRVLGLVASPQGLPALDVDAEKAHLAEALAGPVAEGLIELTWVPEATWPGIHTRLLAGEWHVLHFVGHGDYDTDTDEGVLALVGADGQKDLVEAGRLADLLAEAQPTPRLVVLNSCSSGQTGTNDLFSSTAGALTRSGISAVAAMQFAISDTAAIAFARGFYAAIAHGRTVDEAARSGRISILGAPRSLEWVTPVLYVRGEATHLFTLTEATAGSALSTDLQRSLSEKAHVGPPVEQRRGAARAGDARPTANAADDPAYVDGLSAWFAGRFEEAIDHFTALQARFPDNPLVQERLQKALFRRDCDFWYNQGVAAAQDGDWDQAIAAFEQVPDTAIADIDAYADTPDRLSQARWQQRRHSLIDDVRRLHAARQWEAAIAAGQELETFDPNTPDPDGLITHAREALAEQALAARYATGLQQFDSQDWPAALDTFTSIEQDRPGYRDTLTLLEQLQQRQHAADLEHGYAQARAAEDSGQWVEALRGYGDILKIDPTYRDAAARRDLCRQRNQISSLQSKIKQQAAAEDWSRVLPSIKKLTELDPAAAAQASYIELAARASRELAAIPSRPLIRIDVRESVNALCWHPDGRRIAVGGANGYAQFYGISGKKTEQRLAVRGGGWWKSSRDLRNNLLDLAFSPDGTRLATGSDDKTARIWDAATGKKLLEVRHDHWVYAVAFSPDGTRLATGSKDKTARIWDAATGKKLLEVRHNDWVYAVAFSPDSTRLATGSKDKTARIWDAATGKKLLQIGHDDWVRAVAFSPGGAWLATGSIDKSARFWSVPEL